MPIPPPTADELVQTLKRSSLPTVLVEGDDDIKIFRWLELKFGITTGNVMPCGGRTTLLAVFDRRNEFAHLKTAFIADRDMWLFSAIPPAYSEVCWTDGYSIENDLYDPAILEQLLVAAEVPQHAQLLDLVCEWFAVEVERFRANQPFQVSNHVSEIVAPGTAVVAPHLVARRNAGEPASATVSEVRAQYSRKLRGKQLFQALERFLNGPRRVPKFSYDAQIEVALRYAGHPHPLEPIVAAVQAALS